MPKSFVTRKIDNLGRIVIPKEIRKIFNINLGDELEFILDREILSLRKKSPTQNYCDSCPYRKTLATPIKDLIKNDKQ